MKIKWKIESIYLKKLNPPVKSSKRVSMGLRNAKRGGRANLVLELNVQTISNSKRIHILYICFVNMYVHVHMCTSVVHSYLSHESGITCSLESPNMGSGD